MRAWTVGRCAMAWYESERTAANLGHHDGTHEFQRLFL